MQLCLLKFLIESYLILAMPLGIYAITYFFGKLTFVFIGLLYAKSYFV